MAKQSPAQQETVERVMHEFKHGELEQRNGARVRNPRQAIAIALHEAGASSQETDKSNRRTLARSKAKERRNDTARERKEGTRTRAALYAEARRKAIPGRSTMSKAQLERALGSAISGPARS